MFLELTWLGSKINILSFKIRFKATHYLQSLKAALSVTFDLLILEIMSLFFKNTAKKLKFRYIFDQFRKS